MSRFPEFTPQDNKPLYVPLAPLSMDDHNTNSALRNTRVNSLVFHRLNAEVGRAADNEVTAFVQTAVNGLVRMSQAHIIGGYRPSEIPIFDIYSGASEEATYNLLGVDGEHTKGSIRGAQMVIDALCPEQGADLAEEWEELVKRAQRAEPMGFVEAYSKNGAVDMIRYASVLPGMPLTMSDDGKRRSARLSIDVF